MLLVLVFFILQIHRSLVPIVWVLGSAVPKLEFANSNCMYAMWAPHLKQHYREGVVNPMGQIEHTKTGYCHLCFPPDLLDQMAGFEPPLLCITAYAVQVG